MRIKLSENIKKFRNKRKMTQEQLAEAMGVSSSAVYKWESNQSMPEINLILEWLTCSIPLPMCFSDTNVETQKYA